VIPGFPTRRDGATKGATTTNGGTTNGGAAATNDGAAGGGPGDTASQHAHGDFTEEGPTEGRGSVWAAITSFFGGLTRRQWLTYGGIAGGFFLVVLAGITIFELAIGKPLSSAVSGGHATGSTLGNVFGGHSSSPKPTTHPASTSSATPTASSTPTPSAGTSSGAPTPSAGTPSPSTVPSATPTTGTGAARSTAGATPTP
jgi:hypothetical protein